MSPKYKKRPKGRFLYLGDKRNELLHSALRELKAGAIPAHGEARPGREKFLAVQKFIPDNSLMSPIYYIH